MHDKEELGLNSNAVQTHLQMYQSIIARMASNSSAVKTWCVTLVAALLVLVSERDSEISIFITFIPIALFFILDTYYLSMEKRFRSAYNDFVRSLHNSHETTRNSIFEIKADPRICCYVIESITSISIFPFYALTLFMIFFVYYF